MHFGQPKRICWRGPHTSYTELRTGFKPIPLQSTFTVLPEQSEMIEDQERLQSGGFGNKKNALIRDTGHLKCVPKLI